MRNRFYDEFSYFISFLFVCRGLSSEVPRLGTLDGSGSGIGHSRHVIESYNVRSFDDHEMTRKHIGQ